MRRGYAYEKNQRRRREGDQYRRNDIGREGKKNGIKNPSHRKEESWNRGEPNEWGRSYEEAARKGGIDIG